MALATDLLTVLNETSRSSYTSGERRNGKGIMDLEESQKILTDDEFAQLKPAQKKKYLDKILVHASYLRIEGHEDDTTPVRYNKVLISIFGRSKIANAFKRYLKDSGEQVKNVRGHWLAWTQATEVSQRMYDNCQAIAKFLKSVGIDCYVEEGKLA